jgi:hypothetical protein
LAGHVADGQANLPVWELHDGVPVAADLHVGAGRDVARGEQHAGKLGEPIRQKAPLQCLGDPVLAFGFPALGDVLDGPEHPQGSPFGPTHNLAFPSSTRSTPSSRVMRYSISTASKGQINRAN